MPPAPARGQARGRAIEACGRWLAECLRLGWNRADLDALEALWWKYHDENGRLIEHD